MILLALTSLTLGGVGDQDGTRDVLGWVGLLLVVAGAGCCAVFLLRGHVKGSQLIFAPVGWLLVTLSVLTALIAIFFVVELLEGPSHFFTVAYEPALIGTWLAGMFRPEDTFAKDDARTANGENGASAVGP